MVSEISHTNVKKDSSIFLLVHDVILEDLVVKSPGPLLGGWHSGGFCLVIERY